MNARPTALAHALAHAISAPSVDAKRREEKGSQDKGSQETGRQENPRSAALHHVVGLGDARDRDGMMPRGRR